MFTFIFSPRKNTSFSRIKAIRQYFKQIEIESMNNHFSPTNTNLMKITKQTPSPSPKIKSAWANGSFYLFLFVVVIAGIRYLAGTLTLLNLVAIVIAGIVFIPLVGALQLRQDDRLSDQNFMELVKLAIAQLPLIGNIFKAKN